MTTPQFALGAAAALLLMQQWFAPYSYAMAVSAKATSPRGTGGSTQRLPNWSGVWVLADASFLLAMGDSSGVDPLPDGGRVPLQPKYLPMRAASARRNFSGAGIDGNLPKCIPAGMPGLMQHPMMYEYLFTQGRVTMLFEDGEVRRIYTDGRSHPALDELDYGFSGHSIGHWEGQTLVVDTIGISPEADLFMNSAVRVTGNTHVVERAFLKTRDRLQIDTAITDPELFTKPYVYTRIYQRTPLPMSDPACAQHNHDTDTDIDLTPPPEH